MIESFYYEPSFLWVKIKELEGEEENEIIIFTNELQFIYNAIFIARIKCLNNSKA